MIIVDCTLLAEVDLISAGVVGLIALIVFVFAILSAKNWHWVNVVLLIFTLIASITSIIGMTYAFKHRRDGMVQFRDARDDALKKEARLEKIISGDPLSVKYDKGSLRDSNNRLALAMTGRGHAWRGCTVTADGEQNKFTLKGERDLEDETSLVGAIVYAFSENDGIPANYIGSVAVEKKEADAETKYVLKPIDLVDPQRFENPQKPWTLFEKMPQDQHGIFKEALVSQTNLEEGNDSPAAKLIKSMQESKEFSKEFAEIDIADFTQILKRDFLPANQLGYAADSLEYEQLVDQYAFDGQSIGRIEKYIDSTPGRNNTLFEPAPEEVFIKFSFLEDSDTAVQTDAADNVGNLANDGLYNTAGQSVVASLMQNPNGVTFKTNDVVLIDEPSAAEFQNVHQGKLQQIDRIYVRPLHDFPLMFKDMKIRAAQFVKEKITAEATTAKTEVAWQDALKQIEVRTELIAKSTEDEERFKRDAGNLLKTNEASRQRSAELERQIKSLEAKTDSQYKQIQTQTLERLRNAVRDNGFKAVDAIRSPVSFPLQSRPRMDQEDSSR